MIGRRRVRVSAFAVMLAVVVFGCLATRAGAFVYWTNFDLGESAGLIGRSNLDGSAVDSGFFTAGPNPSGIAVNGQHVYWADESGGAIGEANLDGSVVSQSFITGADFPAGVAVDGQHIYWTNFATGTIGRASLDGSGVDQSFITGADQPAAVAVDGQHVYWANSASGAIGRANLDGSGVDQSFVTGVNELVGVAVDGQHVYWSSEGSNTIGRANLDGSGVDQSFIVGADQPAAVAVDGEHVYWANFGSIHPGLIGSNTIGRANLDGSGVDQSFISGANNPDGLAVDGLQPPSASITTPVTGSFYAVGQVVDSSFGCREGTSGPGIASCLDQGGHASGAAIDTSAVGPHTLTVTATSSDRATGTASVTYTVAAAPSASIMTPLSGASYALGQVVHSSFGCSEGAFGAGIASCRDANGADAPAGVIDTSRAGRFTYRVTVISKDGQTATASIGYTVQAAPSASVTTPADGASYTRGQTLIASYACAEGAFGPGLASCAGTVADGSRIDTSKVGTHSFTVVAASKDGQLTTTTVRYRVLLPSNDFTVAHIHASADGRISFLIKTPGPGTIDVLETAWNDNLARAAVLLNPAPRRFVYARKHTTVRRAGAVKVTVGLNARARRLVAHHRYRVTLRLWVSYTPTAGNPKSIGFYGLHLAR